MIPLRDGVELEAWIFRLSSLKSKAPTVLRLTLYQIDGMARGRYFTQRGYAYAQVYVRGRGRSGGVKGENLGLQVGRDGCDVVEWIAAVTAVCPTLSPSLRAKGWRHEFFKGLLSH
jgi:predicted acyl esterase